MSVRLKMMLLSSGLIATVVAIISTIGYLNFKSESITSDTAQLQTKATLISKAVEQRIDRIFDVLNTGASELAVYSDETLEPDRVLENLNNIAGNLDVMGAHMSMKNGDIYASLAGGFVSSVNAKDAGREWYVRVFEGEDKVMTDVYTNGEGNLAIAMSVPVFRDGNKVALVAVNIDVDLITNYVASLSDNNQVYVSRADGYLLAASDPELIGQNIYELYPDFIDYKDAEQSIHKYQDHGISNYVASAKLASQGWNIWTYDTQDAIYSASKKNLRLILIIAIVFVLISISLIYLLIENLIYKPIGGEPAEIESIVKKIAAGDLSVTSTNQYRKSGVYFEVMNMVDNLKDMISQINETSTDVRECSNHIQMGAAEVSKNTDAQMQQLEQTASAMNEMAASAQEIANNAQHASTAVNDANEQAAHGLSVVNEMSTDISHLSISINEVKDVIVDLAQQTEDIGSILDVIQGVAEQTNLLALNAAIEAARAGEQGRGFAVVADEVRNLATRTQESTDEIQQVINKLQQEASRSVTLMQNNATSAESTASKSTEADLALSAINKSIEEIQSMNTQTAAAAEQQTSVAEEISNSVIQLNDMAKGAFERATKNKAMASKLEESSKSLNREIERFSV
ncbi:methyl-accepting chemotaxis protein [Reinekea thalattae]|uniref:Methyl-accepting chemotaxis protein n=1 Tax=Reinekea thalattae TaxID=2593301 RepID=A0A5C8Z8Q8_9GAMM|nr:methyl-accepting chemotaxis protein [Reinekea thalattae]TXR53633.1 methyl-accepting chemotaxis protein [Reinekea thalattae]